MDDRLERFAHCDPRFFPYLKTTLEKLPQDVRESVLGNPGFQIVSNPGIAEECSLLLSFADPVEHVMHLNMKTLNEPEYRIVFRIAYEFAKYSALLENPEGDIAGRQIDLLNQWGFEKDVRSMQHCRAIQGSDGYIAGYDWAKHQSSDYLLQHFGLYYDEWNKGGLRRMPKGSSGAVQSAASEALLDADTAEEIPLDEAVMEGIMAALKEVHPD